MIPNQPNSKQPSQVHGLEQDIGNESTAISLRGTIFGLVTLVIITAVMMVGIEIIGGSEKVRQIAAEAGSWAPLMFVALKASTYVVAPLSGLPLKIAAGTLFGLWDGVIYTLLGEALGGSINFWIARLWGRRVVVRFLGKKSMIRVDSLSYQLAGWRALLFARIFLSAFYDFISYAAGLTNLPFRQYLIVSILGGLASTTLWVALGASLGEDHKRLLLVSFGILVIFVLVIILRWRIGRAILGTTKTTVIVFEPSNDLLDNKTKQ